MKDYTSTEPVFSESISIVEPADPVNADNANASAKQLLQNTLVLMAGLNADLAEEAFRQVFQHLPEDENE